MTIGYMPWNLTHVLTHESGYPRNKVIFAFFFAKNIYIAMNIFSYLWSVFKTFRLFNLLEIQKYLKYVTLRPQCFTSYGYACLSQMLEFDAYMRVIRKVSKSNLGDLAK